MRRIESVTMCRPHPNGVGRRVVGRWSAVAVTVVAWLAVSGCYVYTPLYSAPSPGTRVALELNDRGRAALEQNIGPEVLSVEGVISSISDSVMVVSMEGAKSLRGASTRWTGESVTFRTEYVRALREKRYSGGRTIALVSAVASSTALFIVTRGLLGNGAGDAGGPGGPTLPPHN